MNITDKTHPWQQVPGWFDEYEGLCLQKYVLLTPPNAHIVELGTWAGRSMVCMAEVRQSRTITSVDNYLPSQAGAAATFSPQLAGEMALHLSIRWDTNVVLGDVLEVGTRWKRPIHLLLVDDHHDTQHVREVIQAWSPHMAPKSYMCFHDYLAGMGVEEGCKSLGREWRWRDRVKSLAVYQRL